MTEKLGGHTLPLNPFKLVHRLQIIKTRKLKEPLWFYSEMDAAIQEAEYLVKAIAERDEDIIRKEKWFDDELSKYEDDVRRLSHESKE